MATPLLDALAATGCPLTVVSSEPVLDMLEASDRPFDRLAPVGGRSIRSIVRQGRELRRRRIGIAIVINRSLRSAVVARLSGAELRVGHATDGRRLLLTASAPYSSTEYEAECYLQLGRLAGFDCPSRRPRLQSTDAETARGRELGQGCTIGVQPGNRHIERQIPLATLTAIVRELQSLGERVVLLGGPEERASADALTSSLADKPHRLVGQTSIRESMGVIANLRILVGGVAGLMHVGVGVGCPTVMVFGPESGLPSKWGHRFDPHRVVEARDGNLAGLAAEDVLGAVRAIADR